MKYLSTLLTALLFVFALNFATTGNGIVFADDDFEEKYDEKEYKNHHEEDGHGDREDEGYEDIGELVGWGTLVAMGTAGLIFPIRRSMKSIIKNFPGVKKGFVSISRFFGKYHIFFGISALALSIIHGVAMYLGKGELDSEGIIGLGAGVLMLIATILGTILSKHKKVKSLRTAHTTLIAFTLFIVLFHIFTA